VLDGKLAYVLQVPASAPSAPSASCGASNKEIVFTIDQWIMDHNHAWDNSQAWFQPLTTVKSAGTALPKAVYLPFIQK